jgi:hypothetical protein
MSFKQVESVIHYTKQVLGDRFQDGVDVKTYVTKDDVKAIVEGVTSSIENGETQMSDEARAKYADSAKMANYVKGMIKNWFLKSKELNGGVKHEYANPGSRAGRGDAKLKELRLLKKQLEDAGNAEAVARVDEFIIARMAEIKPAATVRQINSELIPDELKDLIAG